jgi:hypothetical protein
MTKNAEYKRAERKAKRERGLVPFEMWARPHNKPAIKRVASGLENELFDTEELERWLRAVEGVSDE